MYLYNIPYLSEFYPRMPPEIEICMLQPATDYTLRLAR